MAKILFLVPYPQGNAPSQRYRFEQYFKILEGNGYQVKIVPFLGSKTWSILYVQKSLLQKINGYFIGFIRRLWLLFSVGRYHWIFIHREALLLGPAWYEWILVRIFNKQIIYDFDDAIWHEATSHANRFVVALKNSAKTSQICKLSKRVSAGNAYLADYAMKYNTQVSVIPTTIDTQFSHNVLKEHLPEKLVIGWTGSHSTLSYLFAVVPVLAELEKNHEFEFKVIADQEPSIHLKSFRFSKWALSTEVEDLLDIDIGLMPLPNDEWTKGKCGLKALQYMSLGIPALVSPVGVNQEIVSHGVEGFHCSNSEEWFQYILKLINDSNLRSKMGKKGREKVIRCYSVEAITPNFLSLFK